MQALKLTFYIVDISKKNSDFKVARVKVLNENVVKVFKFVMTMMKSCFSFGHSLLLRYALNYTKLNCKCSVDNS